MDTGLTSSIVLITGASKGMGLACAAAFAREGATVVGVSRSLANLREAQSQLANQGLDLAIYEADLTDDAAAKALIERVEREVGPIDVLVNSAGAARRTPLDELGHDAFQAALDAKYFTYMHVLEPLARRMAARGKGSIVNIVGQGGKHASPIHIAGGAANAALMLASVGYARAYADKGVRVNVINPGTTATGRVEEGVAATMRSTGQTREEVLADLTAVIPMKRFGTPEEVANVAVFLGSTLASYVTGAIIPMDGGQASVI